MHDKFLTKSLACALLFFIVIHIRKGISGTFSCSQSTKNILSFTVCVRVNERFFCTYSRKTDFHAQRCLRKRTYSFRMITDKEVSYETDGSRRRKSNSEWSFKACALAETWRLGSAGSRKRRKSAGTGGNVSSGHRSFRHPDARHVRDRALQNIKGKISGNRNYFFHWLCR